jgi:uncharacterized protein (TIGR02271 family)
MAAQPKPHGFNYWNAGDAAHPSSLSPALPYIAGNIFPQVFSLGDFVIPLPRGFDMLGSHSAEDAVLIGLFPLASDARRAFLVLRERQFPSNEIAAAFQEPDTAPGDNHRWFGQLRQLYHGERTAEHPDRAQSILGDLDLAPHDVAVLEGDLKRGGAVITVRAGTRNQEAQTLLEQRGARILQTNRRSSTEAVKERAGSTTPFPVQTAEPGHLQLFGEVLRVHKEKVSSPEVRVRKEAVTEVETVQVPVTREHLVVERAGQNGEIDDQSSIRVPLSEERVHIEKDIVLREEYKVGKREVTQNEAITDKVRKERILIDDAQTVVE